MVVARPTRRLDDMLRSPARLGGANHLKLTDLEVSWLEDEIELLLDRHAECSRTAVFARDKVSFGHYVRPWRNAGFDRPSVQDPENIALSYKVEKVDGIAAWPLVLFLWTLVESLQPSLLGRFRDGWAIVVHRGCVIPRSDGHVDKDDKCPQFIISLKSDARICVSKTEGKLKRKAAGLRGATNKMRTRQTPPETPNAAEDDNHDNQEEPQTEAAVGGSAAGNATGGDPGEHKGSIYDCGDYVRLVTRDRFTLFDGRAQHWHDEVKKSDPRVKERLSLVLFFTDHAPQLCPARFRAPPEMHEESQLLRKAATLQPKPFLPVLRMLRGGGEVPSFVVREIFESGMPLLRTRITPGVLQPRPVVFSHSKEKMRPFRRCEFCTAVFYDELYVDPPYEGGERCGCRPREPAAPSKSTKVVSFALGPDQADLGSVGDPFEKHESDQADLGPVGQNPDDLGPVGEKPDD